MALHSEEADHFRNPRNAGVSEDADGAGEMGGAGAKGAEGEIGEGERRRDAGRPRKGAEGRGDSCEQGEKRDA